MTVESFSLQNLPLVTIVTPSLNQSRFVEETIKSVVQQDYPHIEYWIIDGGSADNSIEIIQKYAKKYKFIKWISEKDKGQSHAINKGFKRAKGEVVAWLNSDDTYEPGAIRKTVEVMVSHPDYKLVYGEAYIIDEKGKKIGVFPHTEKIFNYKRLVFVSDYIMQPSAFVRRDVFKEIGYLNEKLHWCMDWDFWIRIAKRYPVGYVPCFTANTRDYCQTKTRSGGKRRVKEIATMIRKHTGRKYPPAYFIYGSELLTNSTNKNWLMRNLKKSKFIRFFWNLLIDKFKYIYSDSWVSKEIEVTFFGSKSRFMLEGFLNPRILPIRFDLFVNMQKIQSKHITHKGLFLLRTEIPDRITTQGRNSLRIRSSKTFIPGPEDKRRLSFRLIEFSFDRTKERNQWPLISVIIVSNKRGEFIEETIKSVVEQNYPCKELILVCGSKDKNVDIIKKYNKDYPFIRWVFQKKKGRSHFFNKGMRMAEGEIVSCLGSQDTYEPGALETAAEFFLENPQEMFMNGIGHLIDGKRNPIKQPLNGSTNNKKLFRENSICRPAAFWKKTIIDYIGDFYEDFDYAMDYDYWIRVSKYFRLNFVNKHMANIRIQNNLESARILKDNREILNVLKRNYGTISWRRALIFGEVYAKHRLNLRKNSFLEDIFFKTMVLLVAVYKKTHYLMT